jgi:hypothetical protein
MLTSKNYDKIQKREGFQNRKITLLGIVISHLQVINTHLMSLLSLIMMKAFRLIHLFETRLERNPP